MGFNDTLKQIHSEAIPCMEAKKECYMQEMREAASRLMYEEFFPAIADYYRKRPWLVRFYLNIIFEKGKWKLKSDSGVLCESEATDSELVSYICCVLKKEDIRYRVFERDMENLADYNIQVVFYVR